MGLQPSSNRPLTSRPWCAVVALGLRSADCSDAAGRQSLKARPMCNLYSITTNQAAIATLFRVINRYVGNLPSMPGVFPDYPAAARKLLEIANSVEQVQDGRIHIEKINWPFLSEFKGSPAEYGAGLKLAIERGWLWLHESGTYVKITDAGAALFA
jgi:hypothetical protein